MFHLCSYCIRHPRRTIALGLLITAGVAPGAARLKLRTDGHALVPPDAPEIAVDKAIRERFGVDDQIVVLVRSSDPHGIFNVPTLRLVQELTDEFLKIDGVRPWNVMSLATERGDRVRPGTLNFRHFLEPLPVTREELDRLRDDLRAIEQYTGIIVSYDETATAVFVGVPPGADRMNMYNTIRDIVADRDVGSHSINIIGAPVAEALLGSHILEDLGVPSAVLRATHAPVTSERSIGPPTSLYELRVFLGRHIGLVPMSLAIMALVFLIAFRSVAGAILPLLEVGACLAFVFGLMGWFGVPVYLTIAVMPVILTAVGVADEIHIFTRYRDVFRESPTLSATVAIERVMTEMWRPVTKTSVTTAIGFLSFALSPIRPVQAFGIFTAVGVIFCMLWSLTVIPAAVVVLRPRAHGGRRRVSSTAESSVTGGVGDGWRLDRRRAGGLRVGRVVVLLGAAGVVALAPFGVRRIVIQDSWIDGFAPESAFRRATAFFNDQFLGTHVLLVALDIRIGGITNGEVDAAGIDHHEVALPADIIRDPVELVGQRIYLERTDADQIERTPVRYPRVIPRWTSIIEEAARQGNVIRATTRRRDGSPKLALRVPPHMRVRFTIKPEPMMHPETVRVIEDLEHFIEGHAAQAVGGVLGPASLLSTTHFMSRGRAEGARSVPTELDRVKWLWGQYHNVRGAERLRQVTDENYERGLINVYLKNANFVDTAALMESVRDYEREVLSPMGIAVSFGGDVAVSQTLIQAIVRTQVRSLAASLLGILIVTSLLSWSIGWGVLSVLPCALAVLVNFAVMGAVSMPLGVATSMFSGMTLGIGVDYAIHWIERYRLSRRRGVSIDDSIREARQIAGPAILIDALAVAMSFGILMLSQVPANARLGGLVVLSIASCLGATLLLLPALVGILPRGRRRPERVMFGGSEPTQ